MNRPGEVRLKSVEFRRERERSWRHLEAILSRVERSGVRSLSAEDLLRLPSLHRAALSSLSVARTISLDRNVVEYLESLASRAHFAVYGTKRPLREALADFFARRLPRALRRHAVHAAIAAGALGLGALAGHLLVQADPERYYSLVSADLAGGRDPGASTESLREALYSREHEAGELTFFSSYLFTHNARVGMLAFALGFAAGVPTLLLLAVNGLTLGAFSALYAGRGLAVEFWAWVLPHGVPELAAVVLCGAGGLVLAEALVFPGRHSRRTNLGLRGRDAAVLFVGAGLLLLVAALVEGVFRQTVHDVHARYAVALAGLAGGAAYASLVGRTGA
jgi:uncharacterized membrane protein SpoIIM required for sporulation